MNVTRECPFCLIQDASLRHIGFHLQRVSCFALPRSTGEEVGSENASAGSDQAEIESRNVEESEMGSLPPHEEDEDVFSIPSSPPLPSTGRETVILTNEALRAINDSENVWNKESNVDDFLQQLGDSNNKNLLPTHNPDIVTLDASSSIEPLPEYFIPGQDISLKVIEAAICPYLGDDASVKSGSYQVRPHSFCLNFV
jgi:hypothetical protein